MKDDPIVEEVRRHRDAYARAFSYDAKAILADLRARSERHRDRMVSFPPRPIEKRRTEAAGLGSTRGRDAP